MRAVIYKRVSALKNGSDGTSLDMQQERLEAYAKAQGWDVTDVYEDPGISAKDTNRPELQRMLKDAETGKFDVILVYKLDRLSRSVSDFHRLSNFLETHKVALVSVTQHLDTSSSTGRLLRNILVDFANFERELITERTVDSKLRRAEEGKWNGGHAPYGYKLVDKRPVVVPEEAEIVRKIYALYLARKSMRQVARITGISFSKVELVLMNPLYSGKIAWGKTRYKDHKGQFRRMPQDKWIMADGEHEAIITFEDWQRVQDIKQEKKNIPDERSPKQLFKDLCFCAQCSKKLYFFSGGKETHFYYRCHDVNKFEGCKQTVVRQHELETKVVRKMNELLENGDFWRQVEAQAKKKERSDEQETEPLDAQMERLNGQIKRLVMQMADADIAHLIKPSLLRLENERKTLHEQKTAMLKVVQKSMRSISHEVMKDIASNWSLLTFEEKSEGIRILIKAAHCTTDKVTIEWTDSNLPSCDILLDERYANGIIRAFRF
ncbi:recombinase family protein [Paenibacillus cymbidii]|uniref:recombinase family protein n=1 Tax=Paenibacillus cymbidii TaxID=1639034 RepID=UPI00107FE8C5|nr:recombinase family protein [Paenibacillus cymbidii]